MHRRLIIGIGHRMHRGKGSLGKYIQRYLDAHGLQTYRCNFADPIKVATERIFSFNFDQLYGEAKDYLDAYWRLHPREVFQNFGDSMRSAFGENFWTRVWTRTVLERPHSIICSDVRLEGEAKAIKDLGGFLVRVDRDIDLLDDHMTEKDLDDWDAWDYIVDNNKGLGHLASGASTICDSLLKQEGLL